MLLTSCTPTTCSTCAGIPMSARPVKGNASLTNTLRSAFPTYQTKTHAVYTENLAKEGYTPTWRTGSGPLLGHRLDSICETLSSDPQKSKSILEEPGSGREMTNESRVGLLLIMRLESFIHTLHYALFVMCMSFTQN